MEGAADSVKAIQAAFRGHQTRTTQRSREAWLSELARNPSSCVLLEPTPATPANPRPAPLVGVNVAAVRRRATSMALRDSNSRPERPSDVVRRETQQTTAKRKPGLPDTARRPPRLPSTLAFLPRDGLGIVGSVEIGRAHV